MLLLGVLQAQAAGQAAGSFDLLETQVLDSSAASVTFSSLSSYAADYQHLQIRVAASHTGAGGNAVAMRINGDTGSNYSYHELIGNGSSVSSYGAGSQSSILAVVVQRQNLSNTSFAGAVIDILDPFETTKNPTVRALSGHPSTENILGLTSGARLNTEAISSITLFTSASQISANSRFSLYGIRGG